MPDIEVIMGFMFGLDAPALLNLLSTWGYPFIFVAAIIEGPIVMLLGGALVSFAGFNPLLMLLVLVLADLVGDAGYYYAGYWGHSWVGRRVARMVGVTDKRHDQITEAFHRHGGKILLFTKTQPIGGVALYMAGAVRMNFLGYMWYNFLGTVPKAALFEAAGYYFGKSYMHFNEYLSYGGIGTFAAGVVLVAIYFAFKWYVNKRDKLD